MLRILTHNVKKIKFPAIEIAPLTSALFEAPIERDFLLITEI